MSAAIGSWNTNPIPAPRTLPHLALGQRQQVAALEQDPPAGDARPASCSSRMIEKAVTDLPLPDSPTRPSVSPLRTSNDTSSTADAPGPKTVRKILDREQRFQG